MVDHGVRNQLLTLRYGAPLMIRSGGRLVVAPTFWDGGAYLTGNAIYDLAKAAIGRLAFAAAEELRSYHIASVAVSSGLMRTELVLANMGATEASYRDNPALQASESPHYLGRAVAALAADREVLRRTGHVLVVADLARHYGFTDLDGTQPEAFHLPTAKEEVGDRFLLLVHSDVERWEAIPDDGLDDDMRGPRRPDRPAHLGWLSPRLLTAATARPRSRRAGSRRSRREPAPPREGRFGRRLLPGHRCRPRSRGPDRQSDSRRSITPRHRPAVAVARRDHRLVIPALSAGCHMGVGVQPFRRPWAEDGEVRICNDACS
jgi:hypothetical protein